MNSTQNKDVELLSTNGISKTYVTTKAVKKLTFQIRRGEIHSLIGENGSGKSTLASMLAGVVEPDEGGMRFNNKEYSPQNQKQACKYGVSMMMQEMNTVDGLTVAENIYLGDEDQFTSTLYINRKKMNAEALKLLKEFSTDNIKPDNNVELLSFEDRKILELIKATSHIPDLFIVDEATTSMSRKGRELLFDRIRKVIKEEKSVLFISHNLQEVIEISDTITVLRDGELIQTLKNENVDESDLKKLMVGREVSGKYYRSDFDKKIPTDTVLEAKEVSLQSTVKNVSFKLNRGEILGICGLADSGMHEIGKIVFGATKPDKGEIYNNNRNTQISSVDSAIKSGIGYISKNRDRESLMISAAIKDNISLPSLEKIRKNGCLNLKLEREYSNSAANNLNVKMSSIEQLVLYLSGGNKQKVALAKWISTDCDILVLDCPTRGIDVVAKAAIYELMQTLVDKGKSILIISEEMLELIGMCDRILIIKEGQMVREVARDKDLTEEVLVNYMI